ncbi:MAG: DUF1501 domain-containing protein [Planctomycetes bacterium]|nr:DUF1501 domain-containing protein [Planctomycetota bacterium]
MPLTRRDLLRLAAATVAGGALGRAEDEPAVGPGPAIIVVWLAGGPSQLETFDPHPGGRIGGPTRAIATSVPGVQVAAGYPRLAERMHRLALIRSLVTTEGEHQRGTYLLRTGQPMSPTVSHPALTAVAAHDLAPAGLVVPPHVAVLAQEPPRGGLLGARWDAFAMGDPAAPLQDLTSPVGLARLDARLAALERLGAGFAAGRPRRGRAPRHAELTHSARAMMDSPQLAAFSLAGEPAAAREEYGDTPFGRGCLVARRLVEAGVPAVEVTLAGWDTHVDNFTLHARLADVLDRGLAALLDDLEARDLLRRVVVVVAGEFGRTPRVNPLDGRDHWTRGFSMLLAGRGLRPGVVIGSTDPEGERPPADPVTPPEVFATLYRVLGIDGDRELFTPQGRPVRLVEGRPLARLLA